MKWEIVVPVVAAVVASVGALLGIVVKYNLDRRRPSDKEMLRRWLRSFNKRAWQEPFDPYTHLADYDALEVVLKDNKTALRGGRNDTRTAILETPSIYELRDRQLADDLHQVAAKIDRLQDLAEYCRTPSDPNALDAKVAEIERLRTQIIETLNHHARKRGLRPLPLPRSLPASVSEPDETSPR
jgi:tRNA uridine 5-carbamoylmethylation protein Kti12